LHGGIRRGISKRASCARETRTAAAGLHVLDRHAIIQPTRDATEWRPSTPGTERIPAAPRHRRVPMASHDTDRHLLFGLLALQNGLIDQTQLVAAFHAWTRKK